DTTPWAWRECWRRRTSRCTKPNDPAGTGSPSIRWRGAAPPERRCNCRIHFITPGRRSGCRSLRMCPDLPRDEVVAFLLPGEDGMVATAFVLTAILAAAEP